MSNRTTLHEQKRRRHFFAALVLFASCGGGLLPSAHAVGPREAMPEELENVGIDEHRGDKIPLSLRFTDAEGRQVTLNDIFSRGRPILLTLNYSNCPMLCSLQLNGFVKGLKQVDWTAGTEFDIVTISLDPKESSKRASQTKAHYVEQYARPTSQEGWHFLVGAEQDIQTIARAVGFRYSFVQDTGDYAHAPAVMVLTPTGVISRYLYGVEYDPRTIRLSLVEAAAGRLGSPLDKILLYCFHYDAEKGRYAPVARNIMKLGGAVTVLLVGIMVSGFWIRERRSGPTA